MALQYMKRSNNNGSLEGRAKEVPQLFVGGEFRGVSPTKEKKSRLMA